MPLKAMASISRKQNSPFWFIQFILTFALSLYAQVPPLLSYQGRLTAAGTNFNGQTQFKFALVNGSGTVTFWSNDNPSSGGAEPTQSVQITVTQGLFTVMLGDASLSNMQPILDRKSTRLNSSHLG